MLSFFGNEKKNTHISKYPKRNENGPFPKKIQIEKENIQLKINKFSLELCMR